MSIYKHKLDDEVQAKNRDKEAAAVMKDDDEVCTLRARIHDVFQVVVYLFHLYWLTSHLEFLLRQSVNQSIFFKL